MPIIIGLEPWRDVSRGAPRVHPSSPITPTTSEQAGACSDFFIKKSSASSVSSSFSQKGSLSFACSLASALTYGSRSLPPFCGCASRRKYTVYRLRCAVFFSMPIIIGLEPWRDVSRGALKNRQSLISACLFYLFVKDNNRNRCLGQSALRLSAGINNVFALFGFL